MTDTTDDDWRLTSGASDLTGATLSRQPYRAPSETWDHDHCEYCWAKFMEPTTDDARQLVEQGEVLTEGYTTTDRTDGDHPHWICPTCFDDFHDRFAWHVVNDHE